MFRKILCYGGMLLLAVQWRSSCRGLVGCAVEAVEAVAAGLGRVWRRTYRRWFWRWLLRCAQFGGPDMGAALLPVDNVEFNHGFDGNADDGRFRTGVGYFGYDPELYDYYGYPYAKFRPDVRLGYYGSDGVTLRMTRI